MIDTSFDFTLDSPHYWDGFWENRSGLGVGSSDPDKASKTLKRYHQILWSKELPCGEKMELNSRPAPYYLIWKDFCFASDSITASFRYEKNQALIEKVSEAIPDYKMFAENYIHKSYTIGGMIIFPQHRGSINQMRGMHPRISDRWDLTLECIRRYYQGEDSPLYKTLKKDKAFFDLFVDFKGYVDFFFLQDCVTEDYGSVKIRLGNGDFNENPLPKTVDDYLLWIEGEMDFLNKRNSRIAEWYGNNLEK